MTGFSFGASCRDCGGPLTVHQSAHNGRSASALCVCACGARWVIRVDMALAGRKAGA